MHYPTEIFKNCSTKSSLLSSKRYFHRFSHKNRVKRFCWETLVRTPSTLAIDIANNLLVVTIYAPFEVGGSLPNSKGRFQTLQNWKTSPPRVFELGIPSDFRLDCPLSCYFEPICNSGCTRSKRVSGFFRDTSQIRYTKSKLHVLPHRPWIRIRSDS